MGKAVDRLIALAAIDENIASSCKENAEERNPNDFFLRDDHNMRGTDLCHIHDIDGALMIGDINHGLTRCEPLFILDDDIHPGQPLRDWTKKSGVIVVQIKIAQRNGTMKKKTTLQKINQSDKRKNRM